MPTYEIQTDQGTYHVETDGELGPSDIDHIADQLAGGGQSQSTPPADGGYGTRPTDDVSVTGALKEGLSNIGGAFTDLYDEARHGANELAATLRSDDPDYSHAAAVAGGGLVNASPELPMIRTAADATA